MSLFLGKKVRTLEYICLLTIFQRLQRMVEGADPRAERGAEEDDMREDGGEVGEENLVEENMGEESLGDCLKTRLTLPYMSVSSFLYQGWFTSSPCSPLYSVFTQIMLSINLFSAAKEAIHLKLQPTPHCWIIMATLSQHQINQDK